MLISSSYSLPLTSARSICTRCSRSRLDGIRSISYSAEKPVSLDTDRPRSIIFSPTVNLENHTRASSLKKRRRVAVASANLGIDIDARVEAKKSHDPYVRMVSTPERMCIVTRQKLPWSFLVNLRPTRCTLPTTTEVESLYLLPDRVDRPFRSKIGKGFWVTCHRTLIDQLGGKGPHLGVLRSIPGISIHPNLSNIVEEQLCSRVIYELERLERRLKTRTNQRTDTDKMRLLRRLDMNELQNQNQNQHQHQKDMISKEQIEDRLIPIALLDISHLSNDPINTSTVTLTLTDSINEPSNQNENVDLEIPLISLNISDLQNICTPTSTPVPIYDLGKLFAPTYHHKIKEIVNKILLSEEKYISREMIDSSSVLDGDSILLLSSYPSPSPTVNTNDASKPFPKPKVDVRIPVDRGLLGVDLAMALWRLRLFHGKGWQV